jgi:hypothetical protein
MTVTIINAAIYSINAGTEMAYQIDYSEGTKVRAVQAANGWVRCEHLARGEWVQQSKPYVVKRSKKRNAECLMDLAQAFLA